MPTIKLTKREVERIPAPDPSGKQRLFWDSELRGFGLLISGVTTSKSYVAQRTLDDGRTRRLTIGSVAEIDLDRARAMAADLIHQMRHGEDPKAQKRSAANWTVQRTLDEYLRARKLKPESATSYRHWLGKHLAAWMQRPIRTITADEVEDRHRAIQVAIAKQRKVQPDHFKSETGTRTANQVLRIFGQLWNFVGDRDPTLPANPVRRLKRQWYDEPRRTRLVKADQLPAFWAGVEALEHLVYRDYIKFLLFTGMRRSEAASLRWEHVDFAARVIRVPADNTKPGRALDLPMSSFVRDLLVARRALGDSGWVFPGQHGQPIGEPGDYFKTIAETSGVVVTAHDLRRTYMTIAESCDISPIALKALVNHTLGSDVTSGYIQMTTERLRAPMQKVCDKLLELIGLTGPEAASDNVARLG